MASDLGMHCLSMSHKKNTRRIWVKQQQNLGEDAFESACGPGCEYVVVYSLLGFALIMCRGFVFVFSVVGPFPICLDNQKQLAQNCKYFLIQQFEHMFRVLKRTVSLRRFF